MRVNKRLSKGFAVGANYQLRTASTMRQRSTAVRGTVAQDWQNLPAEEGNSSLVVRNSVSGNYLYELPFGDGRRWATTGGQIISSKASLSPAVLALPVECG